jgi:hypothetical protein
MCAGLSHGDGDERNTHLELPEVAFEVARVNGQILPRSELRGVHIYRDHHLVGALLRFLDERQVTAVKKPHRGHKRNSVAGLALRARPLAHRFLLPNYLHRCPCRFSRRPRHNLQDPPTKIRKPKLAKMKFCVRRLCALRCRLNFDRSSSERVETVECRWLNLERCDSVQSRRPRSAWMMLFIQWMNLLLCSSEGDKGHRAHYLWYLMSLTTWSGAKCYNYLLNVDRFFGYYRTEPNIFLRVCTHIQTIIISSDLCPPMPTHSMTCAHPCSPMLFKLRPCIQKLCNVYYPPTSSLGWIGQMKGHSLSLASARSASWLISIFRASEKFDSDLEVDARMHKTDAHPCPPKTHGHGCGHPM